jgi:hypothetical protein
MVKVSCFVNPTLNRNPKCVSHNKKIKSTPQTLCSYACKNKRANSCWRHKSRNVNNPYKLSFNSYKVLFLQHMLKKMKEKLAFHNQSAKPLQLQQKFA